MTVFVNGYFNKNEDVNLMSYNEKRIEVCLIQLLTVGEEVIKYKELRFYQTSKVDIGVLLKSVFDLVEKGISNPKVTSVSVKHGGNLTKVSHTDEYGYVLEFGLERVVNPDGTIHFKLKYLHSYYVQNPSNVLSVRLEELYALGSEVHFKLAYSVCSRIYRESPILLNYVISSAEDFFKSSLGGVSSLEGIKQEYSIMYDVQSKGLWSMRWS